MDALPVFFRFKPHFDPLGLVSGGNFQFEILR